MTSSSPASDVDRLRRKIQAGWASMENGHGKEAAAAPSSSSDEKRFLDEGSEMEKLSRQLSYQLELNNELLQQVHDLETQHLAFQKDAQEKKTALRQALSVCEQVRGDMMDLKRKQSIALDSAQKGQEEANRARVESGIKQREIDGLLAYVEEAKREVGQLKQEKEDAKREVERAMREQNQLRDDLSKAQEEEQVRAAERRADLDAAARDASQAKSRVGPLEAELRAERARAQELAEALRSRTEEIRELQQELGEAKATSQHFKERADRAVAMERELSEELENKARVIAQNEGLVQSAKELESAMENELRESQKQRGELVTAKREVENELRESKTQLEAMANDLHAQALGRRTDRDRLEAKLAQVQTELDQANNDVRSLGRAANEDFTKREQDFADQRRGLEESKARLQNENARLNELLLGMQREHAAQQGEFQNEREAYEERIADSIRRHRQAEAQLSTRDSAVTEELSKLKEKLLEAQQQLANRTRIHVETLGALETTIHKLAGECQRLQAAHDGLLDEVEVMRAAMREYVERGNGPLEEWHADSRRALIGLAEACETAEHDARDAREHQIQAEAQRDEERSRTFMLEEERSRLEEEVHALEDKIRMLENITAEKVRAARNEADATGAARADLEALNRRIQDHLERANSQNRSAQEDMERSQASLVDAQARAREKIALLEDRCAKSEADSTRAEAARDAALAEHQLMKKKLDANVGEVGSLQKELRAFDEEKRSLGLQEQRDVSDLQKKLAMMSETMRKQSTQLAQIKSLLAVVQEQRRCLQEDKMALRSELDEVLSRSLSAAARDAGVQLLEQGMDGDSVGGAADRSTSSNR